LAIKMAAAAFFVIFIGCDDTIAKPILKTPDAGPGSPAAAPGPATGGGAQDAGVAGDGAGLPPLPAREFQESDFAESDRSRDPFRSFESLFAAQAKGKVTVQRPVLVDRYSLDELKLVGIVTRGSPRALFTDPTGLGWVAKVGDLIAKPEIVQARGPAGEDVAMNWRIDRIRDGDVVFVREDPTHPEIAPATRVIALYPVQDAAAMKAPPRR
jgi:type IV pilus assembly protein PilP